MERGLDGAVGVATGGTGAIGTGVGSKSKATERLNLRRVFGTDKVWTVGRRTRREFRIHLNDEGLSLDDEVDNEEGFSKVEIEEMDRRFFTLPPPENPHRHRQ